MIQPGDILLFKAEQDFLSKIVAWGTGSIYSHVAVYYSREEDQIIDSIPGGGVRLRKLTDIKVAYDVFRVKPSYSYDLPKTLEFLKSNLNASYDIPGVLWLGILKVFSKLRISIKKTANKWQKDRDYFCSELCYAAFHKGGGLDIVPQVSEADITSPGDIAASNVIERLSAVTPSETV